MSVNQNKVLASTLTFLAVMGVWRQENKFYWPYLIYAIVFQIIFLFCYTGFKCLNFLFLTDANIITRELFICCSELSLLVKVINFNYHQRDLKNLLVTVRSFKFHSAAEEEFMVKRLGKFTRILIFQTTCCVIAIIFSCGAPFFAKEPILP